MSENAIAAYDQGNFEDAVLARPGLTVVDFYGSNCASCRRLDQVLGQLADDLPDGVEIGAVNADENNDLTARYGVRSVPTLLFFRDGAVVETRTGVDRRQVLKKAIAAHA